VIPMTRDQWLAKAAQQLINHGGMEVGEAAAYAEEMLTCQRADNGRNPADWDDPGAAADEEIRIWSE